MRIVIYRILLAAFLILFAISSFFIGKQLYEKNKAISEFSTISSILSEKREAIEAQQRHDKSNDQANSFGNNDYITNGKLQSDSSDYGSNGYSIRDASGNEERIDPRLEALRELRDEYPDFIGWIRISGTMIDYPVMQTPRFPEFYLNRSFFRQRSNHGTPFLDYLCDAAKPSDNMIIYGHNMNDGTMFADLEQYKDKEFYELHSVIEFDTVYEIGRYEVIAVFLGDFTVNGLEAFGYHHYSEFANEAEFNDYMRQVDARRLHESKAELFYGDRFLTLSTCEYTTQNSRMVVLARKLP